MSVISSRTLSFYRKKNCETLDKIPAFSLNYYENAELQFVFFLSSVTSTRNPELYKSQIISLQSKFICHLSINPFTKEKVVECTLFSPS